MTCKDCVFKNDMFECEKRYMRKYGKHCGEPKSILETFKKSQKK